MTKNRQLITIMETIIYNFRSETRDISPTIKATMRELQGLYPFQSISLYLFNPDLERLDRKYLVNKWGVLESDNDASEADSTAYVNLIGDTNTSYDRNDEFLFIPLRMDNRPVGILIASNKVESQPYLEHLKKIEQKFGMSNNPNDLSGQEITDGVTADLVTIGKALAIGIAGLSMAVKRKIDIEKMETVNRMIVDLIGTLDLEKLLSKLLQNTVRDLRFDRTRLYMADLPGKKLHGKFQYDLFESLKEISNETFPFNDQETNPFEEEKQKYLSDNLEYSSLIRIIPLRTHNTVIGFLRADNLISKQPITDQSLQYLNMMVSQASIAIENARLYREIEELAIHDGLTGLYNVRHFYEKLGSELERKARYNYDISLLIIDIDHFKKVNDSNGHLSGDQVLQSVGKTIGGIIRNSDIAARYGGDEFIVLIIKTDFETSRHIAERIWETIGRLEFEHNHEKFSIHASIGGVTAGSSHTDPKTIIELADRALYEAKRKGRNRICWH